MAGRGPGDGGVRRPVTPRPVAPPAAAGPSSRRPRPARPGSRPGRPVVRSSPAPRSRCRRCHGRPVTGTGRAASAASSAATAGGPTPLPLLTIATVAVLGDLAFAPGAQLGPRAPLRSRPTSACRRRRASRRRRPAEADVDASSSPQVAGRRPTSRRAPARCRSWTARRRSWHRSAAAVHRRDRGRRPASTAPRSPRAVRDDPGRPPVVGATAAGCRSSGSARPRRPPAGSTSR